MNEFENEPYEEVIHKIKTKDYEPVIFKNNKRKGYHEKIKTPNSILKRSITLSDKIYKNKIAIADIREFIRLLKTKFNTLKEQRLINSLVGKHLHK